MKRLLILACMLCPMSALAQSTGTGSYLPAGASLGTAVQATSTLLAAYADDSPGGYESVDSWLGRTVDFTSIHTGQASESDFINSVGYVLWSSRYNGLDAAGVRDSRLVSIPLIWSGATLAAAASGAYNQDYTTVAQTVLNSIPDGPLPGQSIIYIRTGWEQNLAGEMPWSAAGLEPQFIGAFQQFVTAFRAVDTQHRFRFVWCPNVAGDPIMNSYPGDEYVDVMSMDFYYGLNTLTNAPDPDVAFQEMLDNGLSYIAQMAASHGKPLAFSEWGVNQDNFGNYIKDFYDWCGQQHCLYVTYWDNNGGYSSLLSDGSYPETGAMFRHLWNPSGYPVEPIAAPVGVAAVSGDGTNQITASPVRSSTAVTAYYLYKGSRSGGESINPVATSATPTFSNVQSNGATAFYRVGAGNALSLGYLSTEVSATPRAPSKAPLPIDSMAVIGTGYAVSNTPSLMALSQANPGLTTATMAVLLTAKPGQAAFIAGFPNGLTLSLDASAHLWGYSRDWWNNKAWAGSTQPVPFPTDGTTPEWVRVDFDVRNAVTTFYVASVNGPYMPPLTSPRWSQLGAPQSGQNHNGIYDETTEQFYIASPAGSSGQLTGRIYDLALYGNGVLAAHPRFDLQQPGRTKFTDPQAKTWSLAGGAAID